MILQKKESVNYMKQLSGIFIIACVVCFAVLTCSKTPTSERNTIQVTQPVSTDTLEAGTEMTLSWTANEFIAPNVAIFLYLDSTVSDTIAVSIPNTGNYGWTIRNTVTGSSNYRIKIVNMVGTGIVGYSDYFTILPISVTFTAPTADTELTTGMTDSISWKYSGSWSSNVKLSLYNADSFITIIGYTYIYLRNYSWTIPYYLSTSANYRIKMTSTPDTSLYNFSDTFTITKTPCAFSIISPSSSSNWATDSSYAISWSYVGMPDPFVSLMLFDSTSMPIDTISSSYSSTSQLYYWKIPSGLPTGNYRIKITSTSDTSSGALSSFFRIYQVPASLTISTPSAINNWIAGSSYSINWSSTGNVGAYARLTLYDTSSHAITTISDSIAIFVGSYLWIIPSNVPAGKYRIRMSSKSDTSIIGFSSPFTIVGNTLSITKPADTSSWTTGSTYYIYWSSTGNPGTYISLGLYDSASQPVTTISSSYSRSGGSYPWSIPATLPGGKYRIRISSTSDTSVNSLSSRFTIVEMPKTLSFTTPSISTSWTAGTSYTISWSSSGNVGAAVRLLLLDSLSQAVTAISDSVAISSGSSSGSYSWTIPSHFPGGKYQIRISSKSDTSIIGFSSQFALIGNTLSITKPADTSSWTTGSSYYIYWASTGNPGAYVSIGLYDSASQPVTTISSSYSRSGGAYSWTIPTTLPGGKYRIRITSTSDTSFNSFSSRFTVVEMPKTLSITAPSTSSSWTAGNPYTISWSSSGNVGAVARLRLFDSLTQIITTISDSVAITDGSYSWAIPSHFIGGRYKIRISSKSDSSIIGFSSLFTLIGNTLSITKPADTSNWITGGSNYIYWSSTGNPGASVSLVLCDTLLQPITTISASTTRSSGSYSWTIPTTLPVGKYRVKISSTSDTSFNGFSNKFAIKTPSSLISITVPSTTATWSAGSSQTIFWTYTGSPCTSVNLSLYDGAALASTSSIVSAITLSTGNYIWSIPSTLTTSSNYRIKIACTADTTGSYSSNFTITGP
jgi:hypothetical protein